VASISLVSSIDPKSKNYMLTILSFLECSYPNFKEMKFKYLGKHRTWANCKHLNFVSPSFATSSLHQMSLFMRRLLVSMK